MSRLDLITEWIALARRADYSATRLAELCKVSPSQLRRYFLLVFCRPPQEWINELRLWDAMRMLSLGHPAKYVAATLRFSNTAHFSHRYKEYHGAPPSLHIRQSVCQHSSEVQDFTDSKPTWEYAEHCLLSPLHQKSRRHKLASAQNARRIQQMHATCNCSKLGPQCPHL